MCVCMPYTVLVLIDVHLCISSLTVAGFFAHCFSHINVIVSNDTRKVIAARNFLVILEQRFGAPKNAVSLVSLGTTYQLTRYDFFWANRSCTTKHDLIQQLVGLTITPFEVPTRWQVALHLLRLG